MNKYTHHTHTLTKLNVKRPHVCESWNYLGGVLEFCRLSEHDVKAGLFGLWRWQIRA